MASSHRDKTHIEIYIHGVENGAVTPIDVGLFLNDFTVLYELSRLITDEKYLDYTFSSYSLFRGAKRVQDDEKLYVDSLIIASPLELVSTIAAASAAVGALWIIVQTFEKIYNLQLNRQKLLLELKKLELETQKLERERDQASEILSSATDPGVDSTGLFLHRYYGDKVQNALLNRVIRRLERSPIQIDEIDIRVVDPRLDEARKLK